MILARKIAYKPQTACALLDVGFPTLRYWRENIEPSPKKSSFAASDLLAFRIIKMLIYKKHFTVDLLLSFAPSVIFQTCARQSLEELSQQYLLFDESNHSLVFLALENEVNFYNLDLHVLPLAPVIREHQNAFLRLGNDT